MQEPELQSEDFDQATGEFSSEIRIVRKSECCGEEMKESTFSFDGAVPEEIVKAHQGDGHGLEMEFEVDSIEEGGGRYAKSYFGVVLNVTARCSCQKPGDEPLWADSVSDKVPASSMDELC